MRVPVLPLLLLALALSPAAQAQATEGEWMLHIFQYEYVPDPFEVPAGATVTVMSFEAPGPDAAHTVTSATDPALFDVQQIQPGGIPYNFTAPAEPGTYPYYCRYHGDTQGNGMAGTLVVTEGATSTSPSPSPSPSPTPSPAPANDTPLGALVALSGVAAAAALLRRR